MTFITANSKIGCQQHFTSPDYNVCKLQPTLAVYVNNCNELSHNTYLVENHGGKGVASRKSRGGSKVKVV